MKDYNKLINKLLRISEDMHWELLTEAAMVIRELQVDAARYRWLRQDQNRMAYHSAFTGDELDSAVDHAMRSQHGK